jgi:hypothetical protein
LIIDEGNHATARTLRDHDELIDVLARHFDLYLPAGTQLRIPNERVDDEGSHPLSG